MTMDPAREEWGQDAPDPAPDSPPAPASVHRGCGVFVVGLVLSVALGTGFGLAVSYLLRKLGV